MDNCKIYIFFPLTIRIRIRNAIAPQSHRKIRIRNALRVRNACTDQWGHLVEIYKKPFNHEYAMFYGYAYAVLIRINGATNSKYTMLYAYTMHYRSMEPLG
jgi:hypothetical protein